MIKLSFYCVNPKCSIFKIEYEINDFNKLKIVKHICPSCKQELERF